MLFFLYVAFHRGYMRRCYHQRCDFPGNPELEPEGLYFMAKTAQALVLAAAELSGALDGGRCDLGPIGLKPEEEQEKSQSDEYEAMPRMAEEEEEEEGAGGEFKKNRENADLVWFDKLIFIVAIHLPQECYCLKRRILLLNLQRPLPSLMLA